MKDYSTSVIIMEVKERKRIPLYPLLEGSIVTSVMSESVQRHRGSPPGSAIPGIIQARTLEWVAISFSKIKLRVNNKCCWGCWGNRIAIHILLVMLSEMFWKMILLFLMIISISSVQFSSVQSLSRVQIFATPWIAAHQASLSITNSGVHSNSHPSGQWCHPAISSSVVPFFSCP